MKRTSAAGIAMLAAACGGGGSSTPAGTTSKTSTPIVFSVYGDADGSLNGQTFTEAAFRLELSTNTAHTIAAVENGVTVYRNSQGSALLYLTQATQTTVAHIAANQLFVRYDPTNGIVSFGTNGIGPYYPVAVGWCTVPMGCSPMDTANPQNSIMGALVQLEKAPSDVVFYPSAVRAQQTRLDGPALLTGFMDACLNYDVTTNVCPSVPSLPIKTDQGDLYFQKQSVFGHGIFVAAEGSVL